MAQVVEIAERLDAGGRLGRLPVAAAEDAEVDAAAARVREQDRVLRRRKLVERLERDRLQRHGAGAQPRLGVLEPAVRVRAPHVHDAGSAVDVALLEREQL